MVEFTTGEAAKITGVDNRRVAQFLHKQIIRPLVESKGQGRAAKLNYLDVMQVDLVARLSDVGVSSKVAGRIAKNAVSRAGREDEYSFELSSGLSLLIDLREIRDRLFPDVLQDEFAAIAKVDMSNSTIQDVYDVIVMEDKFKKVVDKG